jgi:hypothetical protein
MITAMVKAMNPPYCFHYKENLYTTLMSTISVFVIEASPHQGRLKSVTLSVPGG